MSEDLRSCSSGGFENHARRFGWSATHKWSSQFRARLMFCGDLTKAVAGD